MDGVARSMRPRALDLFCSAGGAAMGLHRAGFEVVGVDICPQPHYPFAFRPGDAFEADLAGYDLIWASPPCQGETAYKRRGGHVAPVDTVGGIERIRARLEASGIPYIIENVEGARRALRNPITLCGSMFPETLDVRRHRLFECSFPVAQPKCRHELQRGDFAQATNRTNRRRTCEVGVWRIPLEVQQRAMGIDWMTREELSQAIPPAYAEYLGRAARA
jgi:DNA (cytosine-5)-methyltransferase 1